MAVICRLHFLLCSVIGLHCSVFPEEPFLKSLGMQNNLETQSNLGVQNNPLHFKQRHASASLYMLSLYKALRLAKSEDFIRATLPTESAWEDGTLETMFPIEPNMKQSARMEIVIKVNASQKGAKFMTSHNVEVCNNDKCHLTTGILRRLSVHRRLRHTDDVWIIYDVTDLLKESLKHKLQNVTTVLLPLIIKFNGAQAAIDASDMPEDKPIIVSHIGEYNQNIFKYFGVKPRWRGKRSLAKKPRPLRVPTNITIPSPCQLHTWYVDFKKLKWGNWILQPRRYKANYCAGRCNNPRADHVPMTNHAYMKSVYRDLNANDSSHLPQSQCVPIKLEGVHLLYMSNNSITLRNMPELRATSCGCM